MSKLWIGDSNDEYGVLVNKQATIEGVLCVAQDMHVNYGWDDGVEYMHVGLIDGPGNEVGDYCAALLALRTLMRRRAAVLVCDHEGGRALTVGIMYMALIHKRPLHPTVMSHRKGWRHYLNQTPLKDTSGIRLHKSHLDMFDLIPFGLLEAL